jgi:mannose-6-phosphate isomerase-like protein (cupin superfamily)
MMNEQSYIASGILTDYCLGLLNRAESERIENDLRKYPSLRAEADAINEALNAYSCSDQVKPPERLKDQIWQTLENLQQEELMAISNLPLLNKYSDKNNWLKIVKPLLAEKPADKKIFIRVLREDEEIFQSLIWTKVDYPDEVHDDLQECFMILEGACECYVGDEVIKMGPGDYFEIPMHLHHDIKVLTPHVLAVVQRRKVA